MIAQPARRLIWILVGGLTCLLCEAADAQVAVPRALSDGEEAAVYAGSAGLFLVSRLARDHADSVVASGYRVNALDRWWRDRLHRGDGLTGNFLDNNRGSAATPLAATLIMAGLDIDQREFGRDLPFFVSGVLTTKAVTDLTKRLAHRPRPCCVEGICPENGNTDDDPSHGHSFFSGHASSAFYTATFLNLRLRREMRMNWTSDEYRIGRVASPILCFGWAGFVGLSRIHADRHFFTDVLAGALAGTLVGELYYQLAYESPDGGMANDELPLFVLRIPIN
ncbi:MAG: phosphatase PAP2 family protein [Candidatus Zixiibacteriota bacterium]